MSNIDVKVTANQLTVVNVEKLHLSVNDICQLSLWIGRYQSAIVTVYATHHKFIKSINNMK